MKDDHINSRDHYHYLLQTFEMNEQVLIASEYRRAALSAYRRRQISSSTVIQLFRNNTTGAVVQLIWPNVSCRLLDSRNA